MILAVVILFYLLIAAVQGAVVFLTAYLALRLLSTSHWLAKGSAMMASYLFWSVFTMVGYFLLLGDWGLIDGFGISLCLGAFISSIVYLMVWTIKGERERAF